MSNRATVNVFIPIVDLIKMTEEQFTQTVVYNALKDLVGEKSVANFGFQNVEIELAGNMKGEIIFSVTGTLQELEAKDQSETKKS